MRKAFYYIFTALPILIAFESVAIWYLGSFWELPFLVVTAAIWYLGIFRTRNACSAAVKIAITIKLWIMAALACLSPYAFLFLAFSGHHI